LTGLLLGLNILLLVSGQLLWKRGVSSSIPSSKGLVDLIFSPWIIGGVVLYAFATILWLYLLSRNDLSRIYPLQALCYPVTACMAVVLLHESINPVRAMGIGLVVLGAVLINGS
jgi:drug/metabolite transporter (DMT)-like permease